VSKGRTLFPVRETDVPDLKKGAGQTNSLEVQTVGNKATLFVNGTKIAEFNGKPPEGGGLIGLEDLFGEEGRRNRGEIRELCHRAEVPLRGPIRLGLAPSRQRAS